MIIKYCISNIHLVFSFVALRALVREIFTNTIHTQPPTYLPTWPRSDFHRLFNSGFAPSALSLRLNSWSHASHDSDGGNAVYIFLRNCLSSELRVGCCQYSRALLLWALHILAFSCAARSLEVAPRWYCAYVSNARSGDLHFDTSFVALHVLVREIIPNTTPTYIHTYRVIVNECYTNKQVTCNKYQQFFCCHVLRFIVNVWTFTINTILTVILWFFGSYDISAMKSIFSL